MSRFRYLLHPLDYRPRAWDAALDLRDRVEDRRAAKTKARDKKELDTPNAPIWARDPYDKFGGNPIGRLALRTVLDRRSRRWMDETEASHMSQLAERKSLKKIKDSVDYYQHQAEGVRQMSRMTSFLLADEMGLGKTLQALTVTAIAFERGETNRALVVCPASLKGNWGDEIEAHTHFTYTILDGTPNQRRQQLAEFDRDVLIVNYEQVTAHTAELVAMNFGIALYDEAQYLKSRRAKRTKAAFKLNFPRHFLLTGSPILNQIDDLWSLLHRIDPIEFPNYYTFVNRYAVFGGYMDKQIVGIKNEGELRERLARYMIRRTKDETLDLPEKQRIVTRLDMHPEQMRLYRQAVEELRIEAPGAATPFEIENAMVKLLRLKQICGTTATIPGHGDHSAKLDRAVEMIVEMIDSGEPVVVFTQFREVLRCLAERLDAAKVGWRQLHGDIAIPDRQPVVRAWTEDAKAGKPQALICMIQVAGVGLTMTAARKVIFLDKLYAPKLNEQAEDRLHRIGQTDTVQIFELQMRNTVEQRIEAILRRKSSVFGTVVDTDNSSWKQKLLQAVFDEDDEE
jgi:SNF2 family DNA or RNA helicase